MVNDRNEQLIEGSHYRIRSLTTKEDILETKGYFKGYIQIGKHQAMKVELDGSHEEEGTTRMIPCHMIANIDILEQGEFEEEDEVENNSYFG